MEIKRSQPIGIELVKRGIVTEADIDKALDYQKKHPKMTKINMKPAKKNMPARFWITVNCILVKL